MIDGKRIPHIPRDLYAMTLEEIAAEIGSTKKAVAMNINTALKKLSRQIAAQRQKEEEL